MEELIVNVESERTENSLVVKNYDNLLENLKKELDNFINDNLIITNDLELDNVKSFRTKIRKAKDKVKLTRDLAYNEYVGKFCEQCMSIEKEIDKADKVLKSTVESYLEKDTPKTITLEVKGYDFANIEAVRVYAEKLGLVAKVK